MKKMYLMILALLGVPAINAMFVTMPNKEELSQHLLANGNNEFVEKTGIVDRLAGEEKHVSAILRDIEISLREYERDRQVARPTLLQMKKQLVETLFKNHPVALHAAHPYSSRYQSN